MTKNHFPFPSLDVSGTTLLGFGFGIYPVLVICLSAYGVFATVNPNLFAAAVVATTVSLTAFSLTAFSLTAFSLTAFSLTAF